jgi:hypothetical protein
MHSTLTSRHTRTLAQVIATALVGSGLVMGTLTTGAGASSASSAKAEAKTHLLVLADLPKGWTKEKRSSSSGSSQFPGAGQLAGCIGVPSSLITSNPPSADSPYFQSKDGSLEVQDNVAVFPSAAKAAASLAAIGNAKTPSCMSTLMNGTYKSQITATVPKGTAIGTITVTAIGPASYGTGTAGFTMGLPITTNGVSFTATLTAVYFIRGKLGQQLSFNSYGPAFPASLAKRLTAAAARRL